MTTNGIGPNKIGANKGQAMSSPAKIAPLLAMAGKALVGAIVSKAVDSATKTKSPAKQKLDKTRSVKQIQKQYPGAEPKKDKPGEYTYKGVTLIPGKYKGDAISEKEKIIKAKKGKKNGF